MTAHADGHPVKIAMKQACQHTNRHRMAVLPSAVDNSAELIDVTNLTTSDQQRILSRAMRTEGQDNERLLTKIRERQDRCADGCCLLQQHHVHDKSDMKTGQLR